MGHPLHLPVLHDVAESPRYAPLFRPGKQIHAECLTHRAHPELLDNADAPLNFLPGVCGVAHGRAAVDNGQSFVSITVPR